MKKFKIIKKRSIKSWSLWLGNWMVDGLCRIKKLYEGIKYYDPIEVANEVSSTLKFEHKCQDDSLSISFRFRDYKIWNLFQ